MFGVGQRYITQRAAAIESDWTNVRILHLPGTFFPRGKGGKEVFVNNLIKHLPEHEHVVVIHGSETSYTFQGVPVHVLPLPTISDRRYSYFSLVYNDLPGFGAALDEYNPDIVHFHDFCAGASLSHLRYCKAKSLRTLVTYHSPGSSCMQKGLIRANRTPCDGEIIDRRCTRCRYRIKGIPGPLASTLSSIKLPLDNPGRILLRNSTAAFHRSFREFFDTIDAVQVHAQWVRDLLLLNNVTSDKIKLVQLGGHPSIDTLDSVRRNNNLPLRIAFVGRCVNIKGAHILVKAIQKLPLDANIQVHFLGPYWDESSYGKQLKEMTEHDKRFLPPRLVPPENVIGELKGMDVCIIPSLWPETGPLSLLDAFAARVPVIGTDFAGIRERVVHGQNGLLFKWGDSEDLARQIRLVLDNRDLLPRFSRAIRDNYTFAQMASDIGNLYSEITS